MLKIVNLIIDDVFVDDIIVSLDTTRNRSLHDFVMITKDANPPFKRIQRTERIERIPPSSFLQEVNKRKYDAIIIHNLHSIPLNLLPQIDPRVKVIWKAWGTDIYTMPCVDAPFVKKKLFKPLTKKARIRGFRSYLGQKHEYIDYLLHRHLYKKALARIDYFSGVLPSEYKLMCRNKFFHAKEVFYPYVSLDTIICKENLQSSFISGNDIFVGNSGDPTNNHLDVFEILRKMDLGKRKVYCSLSYGGTEEYKSMVMQVGYKYWGQQFVPLLKRLPIDEYGKIIASCEIVIMYHERQQAIGNISLSLWGGCNVYMSATSVSYLYYTQKGYHISSIDEKLKLLRPLDNEQKMHNRNLLLQECSPEAFFECLYKLYDTIEG